MTIADALLDIKEKIGHKFSILDAEIILAFVLKKDKIFIFTHPETKLTPNQTIKFNNLIQRRAKGEPIAYLVGHKEFYGLDFLVNKNVLIPRPETELLVEKVLEIIKNNPNKKYELIDVGTGSGCIPVAILKNIQKNKNNLRLPICAVDISSQALRVAKKNSKLHEVENKIKFFKSDLLSPFIKNIKSAHSNSINSEELLITANLPYLPNKKITARSEEIGLKFEPRKALFAGKDGLKAYRQLFAQLKKISANKKTILCEIGFKQKNGLLKVIRRNFSSHQTNISFYPDLAGRIRLAMIELWNK
ncbi:MAG TPA: peptide chain release factor N(5)-glutamine methyltransferase [bacterium]|nr:peptide chain release factor N(5)-glutamine methyltransferase [bacterium]